MDEVRAGVAAGVQQVKQSTVQRYNQSIAHVQYPNADQLEISRLQALQTWKPSKKRVVDRSRIPDFPNYDGDRAAFPIWWNKIRFPFLFAKIEVALGHCLCGIGGYKNGAPIISGSEIGRIYAECTTYGDHATRAGTVVKEKMERLHLGLVLATEGEARKVAEGARATHLPGLLKALYEAFGAESSACVW